MTEPACDSATPHQGEPEAGKGASSSSSSSGEPVEVECPICYQEYNQHNKCPRTLECLHVFCTECLLRIQLTCPPPPCEPPGGGALHPGPQPPSIPCPLCRHLTPLESGDNALSLPRNSHTLAHLPPPSFSYHHHHHGLQQQPMTAHLATTVTQRVVLSLEAANATDAHFIVLPTVSLRVQQMHPEALHHPGLAGEVEVIRQHRRTLVCVQLMAVLFWLLFVILCVIGVIFGPHFFNRRKGL